MVEYYRQIDAFVQTEVERLDALPFTKSDDAGKVIPWLSGSDSLASRGYVSVDPARLSANFQAVIELLRTSSPDNPLAAALHLHSPALAGLPWSAPIPELENHLVEWAEQQGLDGASLLQVLPWALSPFRRLAAKRYGDELRQLVTNEKFTCPICGGYPDYALLDDQEHGRRYLRCLCCDWQWPFKRMGCGYCGVNDPDRLGYIVAESLPGYKIYCCEGCKSYLKTFDQREAVARLDPNPLVEHVKSLFLDLLAIEKGYLPLHA